MTSPIRWDKKQKMEQVNLSQLTPISNSDIVVSVNGMPLPAQTLASDLPSVMPSWFKWKYNSLGAPKLCVARIDATPMVVNALDQNNNPYTIPVEDFCILFPFNIKTHPDTRPK